MTVSVPSAFTAIRVSGWTRMSAGQNGQRTDPSACVAGPLRCPPGGFLHPATAARASTSRTRAVRMSSGYTAVAGVVADAAAAGATGRMAVPSVEDGTMNRTSLLALGIGVIMLGVAALPAHAQPEPVNGMRPADVRRDAIVGATVVPAPGELLEAATVVLRDGVIEAVGVGIAVPAEARVWSGEGLTVYPGLIDAAVLVTPETLPEAPGRHWNTHVHPELSMADQPPLAASVSKKLRSLGFTAAAVYPSRGIFRGSGTVVALAESAEHQREYRSHAAMAVGFDRAGSWSRPATPGSLMGVIALVRQTMLDAQWHEACRAVYAKHPAGNEAPAPAVALEALEDVINRRQPVMFDVASELDLLRAGRIAKEFDLRAIMLGGGRELLRLDEVAGQRAAVIVPVKFPDPPDVTTLHRADGVSLRAMHLWEQAPTNARRLIAAGVPIALTTHRLDKRDAFPGAVRTAIRHGLSEADALAALTTGPAGILGLDHVLGTIEPGKAANLVVVEGEPVRQGREDPRHVDQRPPPRDQPRPAPPAPDGGPRSHLGDGRVDAAWTWTRRSLRFPSGSPTSQEGPREEGRRPEGPDHDRRRRHDRRR